MNRTVFYLLTFVILSCIGSLVMPQSSIFTFFMPSHVTAEIAVLLTASLAIMYAISGPLRELFASTLGMIGSGIIGLAIIGLISPTYFGEFYYYVPQSNLVTLAVLGISYSLACLEIPHKNLVKQAMDLRGLIALSRLKSADADLKLWMVNHTQIVTHI